MKKSIKQMVGKRIASVFLSALLAVTGVGLLPQLAMPVKAADYTFEINSASIQETFSDNCTVQISGDVNGAVTSNTIDITVAANKTVTITLSGVNIDVSNTNDACAFKISGGGNVVINLEGTNILTSGQNCAGIQNVGTGTLTITGTGSLYAYGGENGAGIGGGYDGAGTNIEITGGTIYAYGGEDAAGIGGGENGAGTNIEITGGTIYAYAGDYGAGIGGGYHGSSSNIEISGGLVTAIATLWGAGIGGGSTRNGSNIVISGGTVTAIGGRLAAGIGGGNGHNGSNIEISGGIVKASGGPWGAGIGGGTSGNGSDISIIGGTVYAIGGESAAGIGGGAELVNCGTATGISISGASTVYVAGGSAGQYYGASYNNGAGAAIGSGGYNNSVSGDDFDLITTGLTTGRIMYYPAGTSLAAIIAAMGSASAPEPIDCMQEVMDDINTAIALGGEQTVTIKGYSALSSDVMELLAEHPQITVVSEFSFDGLDYKITIPGSAVKLNPLIKWYGPKYLFPMFYMYGTDTTPSLQAYAEKYPVPVS